MSALLEMMAERLVRLASKSVALATASRARLAGRLLLLAAVVFLVPRLRTLWRDSHVGLAHVDWLLLVAATASTAVAVIGCSLIWLAILRGFDVHTKPRWAGVYLQAQLAKYIPGSVWQYANRAALARANRIPLRPVALSLPVELGATLVAAAIVSLLLVGRWGALGAAGLLVLVAAAGRHLVPGRDGLEAHTRRPEVRAGFRAGAAAVPLYAAAWLAVGAGFWLSARAVVDVPAADFLVYIGAFTAAWTVGLVAIYAPGGLGVREAVLVAILRGRIGTADALVVAIASRAIFTLVDVGLALVGNLLLRRRSEPLTYEPTAGELTRPGS